MMDCFHLVYLDRKLKNKEAEKIDKTAQRMGTSCRRPITNQDSIRKAKIWKLMTTCALAVSCVPLLGFFVFDLLIFE